MWEVNFILGHPNSAQTGMDVPFLLFHGWVGGWVRKVKSMLSQPNLAEVVVWAELGIIKIPKLGS